MPNSPGENLPTPPVIPSNTANLSADENLQNPVAGPAGGLSEQMSLAPEGAYLITNKVLTTNVATLTTGQAHFFAVGNTVRVQGVDATFDGQYVITVVGSTTTFSYARIAGNVGTVASTGGVVIGVDPLTGFDVPELAAPIQPAVNQVWVDTDKGVIG